MKHILVGAALVLLLVSTVGGRLERAQKDMVITVAASDASATDKQAADYVCDGTDDQVQIQAAIDAVNTAGGGVVQLSEGTFTVSAAAGQTTTYGTCTVTDGSNVCTLGTFSYTDGEFAEFAVGQMLRLSGGNDGSGNAMEDELHEMIATVTVVTPGGPSLTVNGDGLFNSYTAADFVLLRYCILLKPRVTLAGSGILATTIKLANTQDCDVIHTQPTSASIFVAIENLIVDGNQTNQTGAKLGQSNGICFNSLQKDPTLRKVSVVQMNGDGVFHDYGWGFTMHGGGYIENCNGNGIFIKGVGGDCWARISDVKIKNKGHGIVLREGDRASIVNCQIGGGTGSGIGAWAVDLRHTEEVSIIGNQMWGNATDSDGCVRLYESNRNTIVGNNFLLASGDVGVSTKDGAAVSSTCMGNTIVGNIFARTGTATDIGGPNKGLNRIQNNQGVDPMEEHDYVYVKNTRGSAVATRNLVIAKDVAAGNEITIATDIGDDRVLGVVGYEIADAGYGAVQTRGKSVVLVINSETQAIGDYLKASDTDGAGQVAGSGDLAFARVLQANVDGDGAPATVLLDVLLISPRLLP